MQTEIKAQLYNNPLESLGNVPANHLQMMIINPVRAAHQLLQYNLHKIGNENPVSTFTFKDAVGYSADCIMDYCKSYGRSPMLLDNQIAVKIVIGDTRGFSVEQTIYSLPFRGSSQEYVDRWNDSFSDCKQQKLNDVWVQVHSLGKIEW
jgi:hypothetical protein